MPASPDVLVIGGLNWDHFALAEEFPGSGETRRASRYLQTPGGKGANQAVAVARLGMMAALVGRIGSDEQGTLARRAAAQAGVDVTHVAVTPGAATGTALIHVKEGGEKRILAVPGANARVTVEDVQKACADFPAPRVALLSLECGMAVAASAIPHLHGRGCLIVLDPSPAEPIGDDLLRHVRVLKPDAAEARILTGIAVTDIASARRAARDLIGRGAGAVIVQAGDGGDLLVDGEDHEELWLPRIPLPAVDATGAGDAFVATIAAYLADGRDLRTAALAGSAAAALATRSLGAQEPLARRDEIDRLLASQPIG